MLRKENNVYSCSEKRTTYFQINIILNQYSPVIHFFEYDKLSVRLNYSKLKVLNNLTTLMTSIQ